MYEYFIERFDNTSSHVCHAFNVVLNSGFFPEHWTEVVIVPVHNKGDYKNVQNYRGITLVNCLSKLFTTILSNRITQVCCRHTTISDAQFGFRKGKSRVDVIFVLMSVIQKYIFEEKRLYVVFVDIVKCYNTINHNMLWFKLFKMSVQGKCIRIIKDMYRKVKSCVNSLSSFF